MLIKTSVRLEILRFEGNDGHLYRFYKKEMQRTMQLNDHKSNISQSSDIDMLYAINRDAAKFYSDYLMGQDGKIALDYLMKRGLNMEIIENFKLGFAPNQQDALLKYLEAKGYDVNEMEEVGIIRKRSDGRCHDVFRNRLIFPISNIYNNIIGFGGRILPSEKTDLPIYINTADTNIFKKRENLFGLNLAQSHCHDNIILVEGYMDVICLHQFGFKNAVACFGVNFTDDQADILSRVTKEVIICMDSDMAGQFSVNKIIEKLKNLNLDFKTIILPVNMDPDTFIRKNGADRFRTLIENACGSHDNSIS